MQILLTAADAFQLQSTASETRFNHKKRFRKNVIPVFLGESSDTSGTCLQGDVQKVQLAVVELVETTIFSAMVISTGGS